MSDEPLTAAERLKQLRLTLSPEISYELDSVFPDVNGWFVSGPIRRKHKLIRRVEPTLEHILRRGEVVLYVSKGVQYSFWEQYFLGALAATLINQTVFVLTNVRLLLLHSNTWGTPKDMSWMIYYSQISKFKSGWFGAIVVELKDGRTYKFGGFTGGDRKQMPKVFRQVANSYKERGFEPTVSQSRENLCYYCYSIVEKNEYHCSKCGAEYWLPSAIAFRSLIFPSWGDLLMRHYIVGLMELIGYAASWTIIAAIWFGILNRPAADTESIVVALVFTVLILGPAHVMDAWLTYYIARKGLNRKRAPNPSKNRDDDFEEADSDDETEE